MCNLSSFFFYQPIVFCFWQILAPIETDLIRFGERVATEVSELGLQCEREPPQLLQYDAWGNRVDQLITSPAWKRQHNISAEEGLIASAYEGKYGEWRYLISHNIYPLSYVYIGSHKYMCIYKHDKGKYSFLLYEIQ